MALGQKSPTSYYQTQSLRRSNHPPRMVNPVLQWKNLAIRGPEITHLINDRRSNLVMSTPALKSPIAPDVVGVLPSGAVRASCASALPEVIYYADAVAMALWSVTRPGWRAHGALADRAFSWVMAQQRPDGSFPRFSRGDYYVLYDRNEYPRYLAMTLHHLAERARAPGLETS